MTTIHVELEDALLRRTGAVLSEQGLSVSQAVGEWLSLVANRESPPMEPGQPNGTTINAMRERDEDLPSFTSVEGLMAHLRGDSA